MIFPWIFQDSRPFTSSQQIQHNRPTLATCLQRFSTIFSRSVFNYAFLLVKDGNNCPFTIIPSLQWVVSSELDVRSLEVCSQVSRGFYVAARDEEIWRLVCWAWLTSVFWPSGSASRSVSQRCGSGSGSASGSFHHQAKTLGKTCDFYCFVSFLWLFIFEEWCKCTSVPNPHPDPYQNVTDPQHSRSQSTWEFFLIDILVHRSPPEKHRIIPENS